MARGHGQAAAASAKLLHGWPRKGCAGPLASRVREHLYLAWTDTDHRINLLADPENPYGAPVRPEEARSDGDPALCSHQGGLILAWSGADRHLNLARLQ
jgi:hypothetical protein